MSKNNIKTPGIKNINFSDDSQEISETSDSRDFHLDNLVEEILDFYGYPHSSQSCVSKEEKIMWIYGAFAVKYALSVCKHIWEPFYKTKKAEEMAPVVCRDFFEEFNHHIIPTENDLKNKGVLEALKVGSLIS